MKNIYALFALLFLVGWSTRDNNMSVGDGAASSKTFTANKGSGSTNPKIRYNNGSSLWDFANDGSTYAPIVGTTSTQTLTNKTLTSPVINTPTGIVKGDVGLGNVDNTSDATKNSSVATLTNKSLVGAEITASTVTNYLDFEEGSAPSTPSSGNVRLYGKTDGKLYSKDDAGAETELGGGGGGGGGDTAQTVVVKDQKASGTQGGTFTTGAWQTRVLQTLDNPMSYTWISLGSNQITLNAGTYVINRQAPCVFGDAHTARLYNITDSTETVTGSNAYSPVAESNSSSFIVGTFTIAGTKTFEVQHYNGRTTTTIGFGRATGLAAYEVYTTLTITKID